MDRMEAVVVRRERKHEHGNGHRPPIAQSQIAAPRSESQTALLQQLHREEELQTQISVEEEQEYQSRCSNRAQERAIVQDIIEASKQRSSLLTGCRQAFMGMLNLVGDLHASARKRHEAPVVSSGNGPLDRKQERAVAANNLQRSQRLRTQLSYLRDLVFHLARRAGALMVSAVQHALVAPASIVDERRHTALKNQARAIEYSVELRAARVAVQSIAKRIPPNLHAGQDLTREPPKKDLSAPRQEIAERLTNSMVQVAHLRERKVIVSEIVVGVKRAGFGDYLARASNAAKTLVQTMLGNAASAGGRPGRPAKVLDNPDLEEKRRSRAQQRRELRAIERLRVSKLSDSERSRERELNRAQLTERKIKRQQPRMQKGIGLFATTSVLAGTTPRTRKHEKRISALPPDERTSQYNRLAIARERGWGAAVRDAEARARQPGGHYNPEHLPIKLDQDTVIVAIRGGNHSLVQPLLMEDGGLEGWLGEPGLARNKAKGPTARLRYLAGHIIAAWSDVLGANAHDANLHLAAAQRVDEIRARLGLERHRLVAYWHTDSTSGHPHLHIVWGRVREDDLSVWSMAGLTRAAALWLHARSNTVLACGREALGDDVDALAGRSNGAEMAEFCMAQGGKNALFATRTALNGSEERIYLQDEAAAQRLSHVGRWQSALPGGIWLFGVGPDPVLSRQWRAKLREAKRTGNDSEIDQLKSAKPPNRGYWLDANRRRNRFENRGETRWMLGSYLARR